MAYIGYDGRARSIVKIDSISGSFNGSTQTFNLTGSGAAVFPGTASSLIVSLNNVVKEPFTDFTVTGSQITFTIAPTGGTSFFAICIGESINIQTVSDGSITAAKLSGGLQLPVVNGGTGVTTITGIVKGNGNSPMTAATGSDVVTLIGSTAVTNATNLTGSGTISTTTTVNGRGVGYIDVPQNSQAAGYTLVLGDAGKHINMNTAGAFTIPANASVAFPVGTAITFYNPSASSTIAITTDSMILAGSGTTGTRTIAQYGLATILKVASTTWIISGTGVS